MASDSNSAVETSSDSDESSLELSYASSTYGTAGEEGSEPAGIHPFLYEPTTSSDSSEDSDSSDDVSPRLLNLNWQEVLNLFTLFSYVVFHAEGARAITVSLCPVE